MGQEILWTGQETLGTGQDIRWTGQDIRWTGPKTLGTGQDIRCTGQDSRWTETGYPVHRRVGRERCPVDRTGISCGKGRDFFCRPEFSTVEDHPMHRSRLLRGPDDPGHRTGFVRGRGTPTGRRRGCHPRTGRNRSKGTGRCKATKKRRGGALLLPLLDRKVEPTGQKDGKRSKYRRSVKYQVKLVKYQVKLGQGQK